MLNSNQYMIDRQAKIISQLNRDLRDSYDRIRELEIFKDQIEAIKQEFGRELSVATILSSAKFYQQLQKTVAENPILQGEWKRFCSFLKMTNENVEEQNW